MGVTWTGKSGWKNLSPLVVLLILLSWMPALAPSVSAQVPPPEENFESVVGWTWEGNTVQTSGSQSADWWTNGNYSYKIHVSAAGMYGQDYGGIRKDFDFTGVDNITVDILLRQTTDYATGQLAAQVLIESDVVWSQPEPNGFGSNYYVNTVIDTSQYTGVKSLRFRWFCTVPSGWYIGSPKEVDFYIDRLRVGADTAPLSTSISVSPSSFTLSSGGSIQLTVTLTSNGSPLPDKTSLSWSATLGSVTQTGYGVSGTVYTIFANYTAPAVTVDTPVSVTASFAGDAHYGPSSGSSSGTIIVGAPSPTTSNIGYSALVATGQNTYVQSSNGSFGLLLKGQTKTISNSVILNNTGDIAAKVEARFNDSIAGIFGLVSGANVLNATNFALGTSGTLAPLNNSGVDMQVAIVPPGVTAVDARLSVPSVQAAGDYSGMVVLTFSNNI